MEQILISPKVLRSPGGWKLRAGKRDGWKLRAGKRAGAWKLRAGKRNWKLRAGKRSSNEGAEQLEDADLNDNLYKRAYNWKLRSMKRANDWKLRSGKRETMWKLRAGKRSLEDI